MKFTLDTLRTTSRAFEKALDQRGLTVPYQRAQNLWAQIAVGKSYSSAMAQAKAQESISGGNVSADSIREILRTAGREATEIDAVAIFGETIRDNLHLLSHGLFEVLVSLMESPEYCVGSFVGERVTGLGLVDSENAGYIPLSTLDFVRGQDNEMAWMRENSTFVSNVLNQLAGRSAARCREVQLANMRAGFAKQDAVFSAFIAENGEALSSAVGKAVTLAIDPGDLESADSLDFDAVRWIVYDAIEDAILKAKNGWLKPDCGLAEAVIDHVAGRIREDLRLLADGTMQVDDSSPDRIFAQTTLLAIRRFAPSVTLNSEAVAL